MTSPIGNRIHTISKPWLIAVLFALLWPAGVTSAADLPAGGQWFRGTFIQLTNQHEDWPRAKWNLFFDYLRQLKISEIVLQWTVYQDRAFYGGPAEGTAKIRPVDTILDLADENDMQVWVGLVYDPQYWSKIKQKPDLVAAYLRGLFLRSAAAARELRPVLKNHPCFQGWYIPEEIADVTWREPGAREVLVMHLKDLEQLLHGLTPQKKVALSGFTNGTTSPFKFQAFWNAVLSSSRVDRFLFQDGIGAHKLELDYLALYLAPLRQIVEDHELEFQVIVEIFSQVAGYPVNDRPFHAVPAPLARIEKQVALSGAYAANGLQAFSIPDYMTPLAGTDAARLYFDYTRLGHTP